jgi:hypothetical protein
LSSYCTILRKSRSDNFRIWCVYKTVIWE